jgi:hypothetical protein
MAQRHNPAEDFIQYNFSAPRQRVLHVSVFDEENLHEEKEGIQNPESRIQNKIRPRLHANEGEFSSSPPHILDSEFWILDSAFIFS